MKLKIAYLVWNEIPVNNTLFNNQVVDQIKKIKAQHRNEVDITLIVSFPVLGYLLSKKKIRQPLKESAAFFKNLKQQQDFHFIVLYTLFGFNFNAKAWLIPFHYIDNFFKLVYLQRKYRFQIIHCRSYHATVMGIAIKRIFKSVKVIFDARSKFPEEGVFRNSYKRDSASFRIWKKIEHKLMTESDAVVNVSHTLSDSMIQEYPFIKDKNYTIYTSTNTSVLRNISSKTVTEQRTNALAFIGEVTERGVYSLHDILEFYMLYRNFIDNAKLVIVTQSDHNEIKKIVLKNGLEGEVLLYRTNNYKESYEILRNCRFGFSFLNREKEELINSLAVTIMASKTGDYLCAGLPLIYDELIGGVNYLIRNYHLGMLVNKPFNKEEIQANLNELLNNYNEVSNSCTQFALEYFSSEKNAERYFNIYTTLVKDTVIINKSLPV